MKRNYESEKCSSNNGLPGTNRVIDENDPGIDS